ncbi:hypothetical protein OG292_19060 [Streptomyces sp. NBC_01511]|uniref:hypothetical protein n=1 Tax=unclassified Streptomyces TaxID=2593676 RepID=UPI00386F0856
MPADLPAEFYEIHTEVTVVLPAPGARDLTDPVTGRTVIPERVELHAGRIVTPDGEREWVHVSVHGPRRLKSRAPGQEISSLGWDAARPNRPGGTCAHRPAWLTDLIAAHLPEGWAPSLIELSRSTSNV